MSLSSDLKSKIKQDEMYEEISYVKLKLSNTEKVDLINGFHECYFDTMVEVEQFAPEFQRVVSHILSDCVPITLYWLVDFQDRILNTLSSKANYSVYYNAIQKED